MYSGTLKTLGALMPSTSITTEIKVLLAKDDLLLGAIFRVMELGVTNAMEIVKQSGASNRGGVLQS